MSKTKGAHERGEPLPKTGREPHRPGLEGEERRPSPQSPREHHAKRGTPKRQPKSTDKRVWAEDGWRASSRRGNKTKETQPYEELMLRWATCQCDLISRPEPGVRIQEK